MRLCPSSQYQDSFTGQNGFPYPLLIVSKVTQKCPKAYTEVLRKSLAVSGLCKYSKIIALFGNSMD